MSQSCDSRVQLQCDPGEACCQTMLGKSFRRVLSFCHLWTALIAGVLVFLAISTAGGKPTLKQLYDQHRWFELRDAIQDHGAPPLYRGGVASAFNNGKEAERYFNEAIKPDPKSDSASGARDMLADLYGRTGRYQDALHLLDESLKIHPGRADLINARVLFAAWAKHGDQSVADVRPSTFHGSVRREGIVHPVSIPWQDRPLGTRHRGEFFADQ